VDGLLDRDGFQKAADSYPEFGSRDMEEYVGRGLRGYYLTPAYIPVALRTVLRRNMLAEVRGLWRSALAFLRYARRSHGPGASAGVRKE
jgi:hypothetical protein